MRPIIKQPELPRPIAILLALALAGCSYLTLSTLGRDAQAAGHSVAIRDDHFSPRRTDVNKGDTVTWRWKSDLEHNVTFTSVPRHASARGSGNRTGGPLFTKRMARQGTYRFQCTIHDFEGRIVVR